MSQMIQRESYSVQPSLPNVSNSPKRPTSTSKSTIPERFATAITSIPFSSRCFFLFFIVFVGVCSLFVATVGIGNASSPKLDQQRIYNNMMGEPRGQPIVTNNEQKIAEDLIRKKAEESAADTGAAAAADSVKAHYDNDADDAKNTSDSSQRAAYGSPESPYYIDLFFVVGSGRSGTSFLMRSLAAFDIHVRNTMRPSKRLNPKGFFEDVGIISVNNELLNDLGYTMLINKTQQEGHPNEPQKLKKFRVISRGMQYLTRVVSAEIKNRLAPLGAANGSKTTQLQTLRPKPNNLLCLPTTEKRKCILLRMAIKDPRLARCLPFWTYMIDRLNKEIENPPVKFPFLGDLKIQFQFRAKFLIAIRNPKSSVQSWMRLRNNNANERALFQYWLISYITAIWASLPSNRLFVHYEYFLDHAPSFLSTISEFVTVPMNSVPPANFEEFLSDFLTKDLKHHFYDLDEVKKISAQYELREVVELYKAALEGEDGIKKLDFKNGPFDKYRLLLDLTDQQLDVENSYTDKIQLMRNDILEFIRTPGWNMTVPYMK